MKLYEIVGWFKELYEHVDEFTDQQTIRDTIEACNMDEELEIKADGYVKLIKQLLAESKAFKAEAVEFEKKAKARDNLATALTKRLYDAMNAIDVKEIPNDLFTIKIQRNGGVAPLIFIEGKEIPEDFYKVVKEVDNSKIREALKQGALDFAKEGERGTRLVIK